MKTIKVFYCYGSYYEYPEGIDSLPSLIELVKATDNSYIFLKRYETKNCVYPYFIYEETKKVALKLSDITEIEEEKIFVISKTEYEEKLKKCVADVCRKCQNYEEDSENDNMRGHRDKINLDGGCEWFRALID